MYLDTLRICLIAGLVVLFFSCTDEVKSPVNTKETSIRFEKITYYKTPIAKNDSSPYKSRLTYFFDNGLPHRWMELDSAGKTQIDYIYEYDSLWQETGASYIEPGEINYSGEIITYKNDSTKVTEWPDSTGTVFYTMIDDLNKKGKSYRATFIGDTIHGYDSTFYTARGFEKRIFFTNNKGKVLNDRSFEYDSINTKGDWIFRNKIMNDTVVELQYRELHYDEQFIGNEGLYYEGQISLASADENVISFSENEEIVFFTRSIDWQHQKGYLATKEEGIYTVPQVVPGLDSIYNGAISPKGDQIIYCTRDEDAQEIWLIKKENGTWLPPTNLTATSGIEGGYFQWYSDSELYMYIDANEGDVVRVLLQNELLKITDTLSGINTNEGTEFSPFVLPQKKFLLFTRYLEGDPSQQGIFLSQNTGTEADPNWAVPKKIETLPYGWSPYIINNDQLLIYTDGEDFYGVPIDTMGLDKI
ncbi:MAG: hypothetical protein HKP53_06160 [Eudoraea sp.]|nr:hypothetical protein [Eudoraea sp.]